MAERRSTTRSRTRPGVGAARGRGATGSRSTASTTTARGRSTRTTGNIVLWPDDPSSGSVLVREPAPRLATPPLSLSIPGGRAPAPRPYPLGTPEFRYWDAAGAARRGADLWASLLPAGTGWEPGATLPLFLDEGVDLNAYYDRRGLNFFHGTADGRTVYSAESPDVVCHELGHAVLDALRPQLWDAASSEVAAFHESFGDMSAILSALQVQAVRTAVLAETSGVLYRSSRLSRLAVQLGWAIRQTHPDAVDPDCLRNAVNSFFYQQPETLPPSAPASMLSSEPHSFSRVFTAVFFEGLGGMLTVASGGEPPDETELLQVSRDMCRLLVDAVLAAPVVPDYYSQIAAHLIEADQNRFAGRYSAVLKGAFVHHGILSLDAATAVSSMRAETAPARGVTGRATGPAAPLPRISLSAAEFGLGTRPLYVNGAGEAKRFAVASAAAAGGSLTPSSSDVAARAYVEDLLRRGRVDVGADVETARAVAHPLRRKTHELRPQDGGLFLARLIFDCAPGTRASPAAC